MFAETRTFENAIVGERINPFIVAPGTDRQTIACVQHANFFTSFESPRYRHRGLPPFAAAKSRRSDHVRLAEPRDVVPRITERLGEQYFGVLAEFRGVATRIAGRRAE